VSTVRNPFRIGLKLASDAPIESFRQVWRIADDAGFDHCWAFDHLVATGAGDTDVSVFEGWSLLAAMAEATTRVRLGLLVSGMTYRNPALLAKLAVTIDHLSSGRLEFGVGAGYSSVEHQMYGIGATDHLTSRFSEGLQVLKMLWTQGRSNFDGQFYRLENAVGNPKPVQNPHPPIWIGAARPAMLRVTAAEADVWNWAGDGFEAAKDAGRQLIAACRTIGRDPSELRWSAQLRFDGTRPAALVDELRGWFEAGFTELVISCAGSDPVRAAAVAAEEVLPKARRLT
jgi:alkanesulfonate monooxygenase SsuD/methylene tetrahydromethanopterin reductase-like flavin-dependent oxidoreductase (luciferase family)